ANAAALGLNFSAKLFYAAVSSRAVRTATLQKDNTLMFDSGTVDFSPDHVVTPGPASRPFPPMVAKAGSVGDASYSPLVRITNAGGHIYNAPIIAMGDNVQDFMDASGKPNNKFVHDKVVSINISRTNDFASTVTLGLTTGFSFAKPVLYLSTEASVETTAALEGATLAEGLQDIKVGNDDSAFSAIERLFLTVNGPTGCDNPQRQGLFSALTDGRGPLNVLGGIPTVATDYSPLWDVNVGEWTQQAIDRGWRSRVIDEFQVLSLVEVGAITGPGGTKYGSAGFIVNFPIAFRFLLRALTELLMKIRKAVLMLGVVAVPPGQDKDRGAPQQIVPSEPLVEPRRPAQQKTDATQGQVRPAILILKPSGDPIYLAEEDTVDAGRDLWRTYQRPKVD